MQEIVQVRPIQTQWHRRMRARLPPRDSRSRLWQGAMTVVACLFLGLARTWIGRYSLNPDGISYLDLSDALLKRHWNDFLNAYWSPLYPFLLATSRLILPTSKHWELPGAHILNFGIFLVALGCFEFFYSALRQSLVAKGPAGEDHHFTIIAEWPFWVLSHALFLWVSLDLITVWDLTPDLCVSAFVYLIAGLIVRTRCEFSYKQGALLGAALGFSYWAKAVMFPLAFAFMLTAALGTRNIRTAMKRGAVMAVVFAIVAGPLVLALSVQKHRLTFGDSGRLNYAMFVSPGGVTRNWQGDPAWGVAGAHTTRKIPGNPPVYEFAGPVAGTFPPYHDPSYWQEGRVGRFKLKPQILIIGKHLFSYLDLLLHQENALLATLLAFLLFGGKMAYRAITRNWLLLLLCAAPFGLYMLVHAETRFLGAYVAVLWIALLSPLRLDGKFLKLSNCLLLAVAAALLMTIIDNTARAIREDGPYSAMSEIVLSDGLDALGLRSGDRIGIVGGAGIYAARLSHLKIVAEITEQDSAAFWKLSGEQKARVFEPFAESGARAIVASDPGPLIALDSSWRRINGLPYCVLLFSAR